MHKYRILVPVSFGSQSDMALKQARSIALQLNAMITCLHVIDNQTLISGNVFNREKEQKSRLESELKLASKVNSILSGNDSVLYELIVTSGKVYRKILEKASELHSDMIVMGRSDAPAGKKLQLGSNASKVMEKANIPVLTIRDMQSKSLGQMMVPLDLSAQVSLQLAKTIELAEKLNATVTAVAVAHPGEPRLEAAYKKRLIEIKKLFAHYDIFSRVKLIISERKVADHLLSCSLKYQPDLLVLMTQQEGKTADLALGSVANELICNSEFPVLSMTPLIKNDLYPFKSAFGSINHPIKRYDMNDHVIVTN